MYVCVHLYVCVYVSVCIYICIYICMYVYMYVYICSSTCSSLSQIIKLHKTYISWNKFVKFDLCKNSVCTFLTFSLFFEILFFITLLHWLSSNASSYWLLFHIVCLIRDIKSKVIMVRLPDGDPFWWYGFRQYFHNRIRHHYHHRSHRKIYYLWLETILL